MREVCQSDIMGAGKPLPCHAPEIVRFRNAIKWHSHSMFSIVFIDTIAAVGLRRSEKENIFESGFDNRNA